MYIGGVEGLRVIDPPCLFRLAAASLASLLTTGMRVPRLRYKMVKTLRVGVCEWVGVRP